MTPLNIDKPNINKALRPKPKLLLAISLAVVIPAATYYVYQRNSSCRGCIYNQNSIVITQTEYDQAYQSKQTFYEYSKQKIDENTLKKDVLDQLKAEKKIQKYAAENNITVSQSEIDSLYQERVRQNKSEEELLAKIKLLYGYTKEEYRKMLGYDVLRAKVQLKVNEPLTEWLNKQPD